VKRKRRRATGEAPWLHDLPSRDATDPALDPTDKRTNLP
jgi:hypothetical protein